MDKEHIPKLIEIGSSPTGLREAQKLATRALADADKNALPKNGSAATLSALLQLSGMEVPMTLGPARLANSLGGKFNSRHWNHIPVGKQQTGDVGVCFDDAPPPGADHVYLVINALNGDEMIVADNQAPITHSRFASGRGKETPTDYFLRVPQREVKALKTIARSRALDAADGLEQILEIAANSVVARHRWWKGQGLAPIGYTKGMAAVYARVYCKLKSGEPSALEMAKANTGDVKDVLVCYGQQLAGAGLDENNGGPDTLRHLFVVLIGLAMPESSGRYWLGVDPNAHNHDGETAEAGLFQTSWNARAANPKLTKGLLRQYLQTPSGFLEVFKEGVPKPGPRDDLNDYGRGDGKAFQRLSKDCPAFAAEFTGVGLRNIAGGNHPHWGTIRDKSVEIVPDCDAMLKQVQDAVDASKLCPVVT